MESLAANEDDVVMLEQRINNLKIGQDKHDTRVKNTGIIICNKILYIISYHTLCIIWHIFYH